ncbi:hypothetical protein KI688_005754 [Linnemannia hyalina]|uniref:FAD-binding domain-containing protein n=1 Tax=Linnemannia hyalina TaxID=64524 RepID=A0A9P7Y3Q5_9FUNG|nr:hypothetical protein KI688_005754 [Linnemannia hyalina]
MPDTRSKPTVLIVGAGLGGLMLGALLERQGVPYTILERAAAVKPLGSAMTVGPVLLAIFQQLGIYDELRAVGKYMTHIKMHNESLQALKPTDYTPVEEQTGYGFYVVARPVLYELILKLVPPRNILFDKKVVSISETDEKVTVRTGDNAAYEGDVLVGADGAHSTVRQHMYEALENEGKLPKSDQEDLPFSCTCLVGQTRVLDPEEFPLLKDPVCQFLSVMSDDKPYSWATFTTTDNKLAFMVVNYLGTKSSKAAIERRQDASEREEWGPFAAQAMCEETSEFPVPIGDGTMTLGDVYELTPKDMISKVMLEEKVFDTWYSGRIVLLGDSCHKLNPAGGQGAANAFHDAVALANLLYAMPTTTSQDITQIFIEYHAERHPAAKESFENSQLFSKIMDRGIGGAIALFFVTHTPFWLWKILLGKTVRFRPQIGFIQVIPATGSIPSAVSPSTEKAKAVFERLQQPSGVA